MVNSQDFWQNSYESLRRSNVSNKKVIPPWCSSRKVCRRSTPKSIMSKREILSTYPPRKDIWEYLYGDNNENFANSQRKAKVTETLKNRSRKTLTVLFILFSIIVGLVALLMSNKIPKADLITEAISSGKIMTLMGLKTPRTEGCCQRIMYLASKLSRIKNTLRYETRQQKHMALVPNSFSGATVRAGRDTIERRGRVALWGILPLWETGPPLNTIFAIRTPTPSDCWAFSGSQGEVIIQLPHIQSITYVIVEHIRPDTAKSAPNSFVIHGLLINDTKVELIRAKYELQGPAKQFYPTRISTVFKSIIYRILTNQGNQQYTCLYRFYMYSDA